MNRGQVLGIFVLWIAWICFCYGSWRIAGSVPIEEAIMMMATLLPAFFYFAWVIIGLLGVE